MDTLIEILGAVALLMWGLRMVRTGVMRAYGARLSRMASRAGGKILPAFSVGVLVAAVLQSSTATSMMAASFAARGVLDVSGAFFVMLGADIGTTLAVFIASQKITWLAPVLTAIGVFGFLSTEDHRKRSLMRAFIGIGLVLFGLSMIAGISNGFITQPEAGIVLGLLVGQPALLVLFAIILTYLAHSSLAILLMVTGFVISGFLDLSAAFYLVLGANIGSGLLPVVANWHAHRNARIPVTANLIVRSLAAIAAFFVVPLAAQFIDGRTPLSLAPALFHLALNSAVVVVGIVASRVFLGISDKILPKAGADTLKTEPKFLDETALGNPVAALACAKREALHIAEIAQGMVYSSYAVLHDNDSGLMQRIVAMDDDVDRLFNAIKIYLSRAMQQHLSEEETQRALDTLSFTANMEHVGDIVQGGLMELAAKKINGQFHFSDEGLAEIRELHDLINASFDLAVNTYVSDDVELAHQLYAAKSEIRELERRSLTAHFERIGKGKRESLATSSLHLDIIRDLKRINSHLTSIAYPVLNAAGEEPKTKKKRG